MRRILTPLVLFAVFCVAGARAWWCVAHMIIAEIARMNLEEGVESQVNDAMYWLSKNGNFPQSPDMVNGACWADDIKPEGLHAMAGWHFINQPYNPNGVPIKPHWPIQHDNVAANVMTLGDTLKGHDLNQWIKSFSVANLLHFYGDVHQPLHAAELFDAHFPDGDRGGNLFPVQFQNKTWRLHFVWDAVCGQYQNTPPRPLDSDNRRWIESLARQYMDNFTVPDEMKNVWNATEMALESLAYASKYAYANNTIVPNQQLDAEYISVCEQAAGYRIAYAGWRLAHELNHLYGRRSKEVTGEAVLRRLATAMDDWHDTLKTQSKIRA